MSLPRRPSAKQCGGFNVTNASQVAVADNPSRLELVVTNNSAVDISLGLRIANGLSPTGPTAVANDGIVLKASGGSWATTAYTGPVAAIAGVAGPSRLAITEI